MPPAAKYRWCHIRLATVFLFVFFFAAGVLFERLLNAPIDEQPDLTQSTKDSVLKLTLQKLAIEEELRMSASSGETAEINKKRALSQIEDINFTIRLVCENMERVRQHVASLNN